MTSLFSGYWSHACPQSPESPRRLVSLPPQTRACPFCGEAAPKGAYQHEWPAKRPDVRVEQQREAAEQE